MGNASLVIEVRAEAEVITTDKELALPPGWYLYVWGAVYYRDGFGEDRETRYCHRYNCVNVEEEKSADPGNVCAQVYSQRARSHS